MVGDDRPTTAPAAQTQPHDGDPFGGLAPGALVGKYEIVEILGQGGFGITYRAHDTQLHRDVALKEYLPTSFARRQGGTMVLPRSTQTAEDFLWGRTRFLEEARTLARLENAPGIVTVHDFLEANGTAYMVMMLAPGETLEARLKRDRRLQQPAIEQLLYPLLDGLEIVHEAGFLHRDIKPANILLDANGRPTLIDFGASRVALQGRTQAMTAVYTPGYAAFEQFTSARQGPWTDIYALAGTLYHCVTGRTAPGALDRVHEDALVPAVEAGKGRYAPSLLAAIDAGLKLKAADRPQSIADWRRVLSGIGGAKREESLGAITRDMDEPVTRRMPAALAETPPPARRRAAWVRVVAALMVLAIAGGGAWVFLRPPPDTVEQALRRAEEEARRQTAVATKLRQEQQAAAEAQRKAQEEATRKLAEEKAAADAAQRQQAEDAERQRSAAAEAQRKAQEETARKAAEEKAAADAATRRKADDEAAARRRVEEQARAEAAARRKADEEAARRAAAEVAGRRTEEQARAEDARRTAAAEKAAAEAKRKAEEEAAWRAAAEAAARRAEEQARAEDARRTAAAEKAAAEAAARRKADDDVRKAAEDKAKTEADAKRQAEAAEAALRLSEPDRKRVQVALTSLGHDTRGSDGGFGLRTRQMIAAWQKSRGQPETGYLTGAQFAALRQQAAPAIAKFDEEQKKLDDDKRKAEADAKRSQEEEAKRRAEPQAKPAPPGVAAAPPAAGGLYANWAGFQGCLVSSGGTISGGGGSQKVVARKVCFTASGSGRYEVTLDNGMVCSASARKNASPVGFSVDRQTCSANTSGNPTFTWINPFDAPCTNQSATSLSCRTAYASGGSSGPFSFRSQ